MKSPSSLPVIGVSRCLLGERVRYDGAEKGDPRIIALAGTAFEVVPLCPEVGASLPVPRPPVHLVERNARIRMIGVDRPQLDVTAAVEDWIERTLPLLHRLDGLLLKSRSPSCGVDSTPLQTDRGLALGGGLLVRRLRPSFDFLALFLLFLEGFAPAVDLLRQ